MIVCLLAPVILTVALMLQRCTRWISVPDSTPDSNAVPTRCVWNVGDGTRRP